MSEDTYCKACRFSRNEELYVARHCILTHARLKPLLATLIACLEPSKSHFTAIYKGERSSCTLQTYSCAPVTTFSIGQGGGVGEEAAVWRMGEGQTNFFWVTQIIRNTWQSKLSSPWDEKPRASATGWSQWQHRSPQDKLLQVPMHQLQNW